MKLERYSSTDAFAANTREILLRHEVQNNLPLAFMQSRDDTSSWLMAAVRDDGGDIVLTAACTPPYNVILFETDNRSNDRAVAFLADRLKALDFHPRGVLAEQSLAGRFALAYAGEGNATRHTTMNIMRLDRVADFPRASGRCRPLEEGDLAFVPYWERAFGEECREAFYDLPTHARRAGARLGKDAHYIWEDGAAVSQAVHSRSTGHGAVIGYVYTPPYYRNRGYAASLVAAMSQILLDRGNAFCCLFADAANPISCGIYRKIGYQDLCIVDDLRFETREAT